VIRRLARGIGLLAVAAIVVDRWLGRRSPPWSTRSIATFVVIEAPIERVWGEIADVERQPRWMHDLKHVRVLTPGSIGVGTRAEGTVRIAGITVRDPVAITRFEPPTVFEIRHDGAFRGRGLLALEPGADGRSTIVRWEERLVPPLVPDVGAVALRPVLRQVFQADLHRLRRLLEA
jgi:uncharacterized protein YndB with AHSA1/START domain